MMSGPARETDILPAISSLGRRPVLASPPFEREVVDLFDQLRDRLLRYVLGLGLPVQDCEEIIQETFLALFQHLRQGKPRQNLRGWLFRVAHNQALKKRQQSRRDSQNQSGSIAGAEELLADSGPNPEDQLSDALTRKRLLAVVDALSEQDRRCLALRAEGLRYREIAEVLDMSLGSVAASLGRSLGRIARAAER